MHLIAIAFRSARKQCPTSPYGWIGGWADSVGVKLMINTQWVRSVSNAYVRMVVKVAYVWSCVCVCETYGCVYIYLIKRVWWVRVFGFWIPYIFCDTHQTRNFTSVRAPHASISLQPRSIGSVFGFCAAGSQFSRLVVLIVGFVLENVILRNSVATKWLTNTYTVCDRIHSDKVDTINSKHENRISSTGRIKFGCWKSVSRNTNTFLS